MRVGYSGSPDRFFGRQDIDPLDALWAVDLRITWTKPAKKLPPEVRKDLASMMEKLHRYFREIPPRMQIGISRAYDGLAFQSYDGSVKLMLGVKRMRGGKWRMPTYYTIAHELMHLVQFNSANIPGGERACDVYCLSRLPPKFIDESPTYLVVPRGRRTRWTATDAKMAHDIASEALTKRSEGMRRYASWWESEFERRVKDAR